VSSEGSKIVITSGEEYWVIYCVVFDGKSYQCERCMEKGINEYASRDGVTQYCDNIYLKNPNSLETTRIEAPWFTIIKETPKKLVFEIDPNHSGEDRIVQIGIRGGDCHTGIDIEQSAE
jgi:hypothetical protein